MKVAFYVVYPNEFVHFEPLRRHLPEAEYVVGYQHREQDQRAQILEILRGRGYPCVDIGTADLSQYDAYVIRYYTRGELLFPKATRRIRIMYGYLNKNNTTYALENTLYDLVLTYGPWATRHMEPYAPCCEVGNMHLDSGFAAGDNRFPAPTLGKPRVLYLPTLSFRDQPDMDFSSALASHSYLSALASEFELSIKLHPDAAAYNPKLPELYRSVPGAQVIVAHDDIKPFMRTCAAVISDFSGTIFEAMGLGIPVVLLTPSSQTPFAGGRCFLSLNAIEERRIYQELGTHNVDPQRLVESVHEAIRRGPARDEVRNLFYRPEHLDGHAGARAAEAIRAAVASPPQRNNTQEQMRRLLFEIGRLAWPGAAEYAIELQRPDLFRNVIEAKRATAADMSILPSGVFGVRKAFAAMRFLSRNAPLLGISRWRAVREAIRSLRGPAWPSRVLAALRRRGERIESVGGGGCAFGDQGNRLSSRSAEEGDAVTGREFAAGVGEAPPGASNAWQMPTSL
jgi:hypothetical protein